jgi:hypothetical protein
MPALSEAPAPIPKPLRRQQSGAAGDWSDF